MDVKKELIIGGIGATLIIFLTFFYFNQYKNLNKSSLIKSPDITKPSTIMTDLTVEEVTKHGSENDCWLIINNSVYGVTQFLTLHPGGKNRIIPYCGQDASVAFSTKGGKGSHSTIADGDLKKLKIGQLNETVDITETDNRIQNDIKSIRNLEKNEREKDDDD